MKRNTARIVANSRARMRDKRVARGPDSVRRSKYREDHGA